MATRNVEYIIGLRDKFSSKITNIQARTKSLDSTMMRLRSTVGTLFTAFAAQRVISDIIKVGSNFEQLQISFETMLGSAEKARNLLEEITKFAIETPFELKDVAKGAKALLAFGIAQEKIIPTLKSLGDVAAGLSVPIERLILNFGQVKTQSKLTGRELRDFAIAGVPLLDELAKVMGKTTTEVQDLVSKGAVGFPIVEQAFKNMSSEGGKFFDLMQKQTASTGGQISNLRDVVALLENDLFKKFQPAINDTVIAIQKWIAIFRENIDTIVEIIKITGDLIKLFVAYKAIQLSVNLAIRAGAIAQKIWSSAILFTRTGMLELVVATKAFKVALARTGIGLAIVGIAALIVKFSGLSDILSKTNKVQTKFNKINIKTRLSIKDETEKLKDLFDRLKTTNPKSEERNEIIQKINAQYPGLLKNIDLEKAGLADIALAYDKVVEATERRITAQILESELTETITKIRELNLQLADKDRAESFKSLVQKRDELRIIKARINEEIKGNEFNARFSKEQQALIKERTVLQAKLDEALTGFSLTEDTSLDQFIKNAGDRIKVINDLLSSVKKATTASGFGGVGGVDIKQVGITKITSAAPKIFNINIDSLVETLNINSTTVQGGAVKMKEAITEALLTALSDVQIQTR